MEFLLVWALVGGFLGAAVGSGKKMGGGAGLAVGLMLGLIGVIIVAASPSLTALDKVEAKPAEKGWFTDPLGRFDHRYFDGHRWTQHVGRIVGGQKLQLEDPL